MSPLLLVVLALLICYLCWTRRHLYYLSWKLKGRLGYPLIGTFFDHLHVIDFGEYFEKTIWSRYASPCVIWLGGNMHILVKDVDFVQSVLTNNDMLDKHSVYKVFHPVSGKNSLIFAKSELWKNLRRIFNPKFNLMSVNKFVPTFNNGFDKYVNFYLKQELNKGAVDLYGNLVHMLFSLSFETLAGKNLDWVNKTANFSFYDTIHKTQSNMDDRSNRVYLHSDFLYSFTKNYQEVTTNVDKIHKTLKTLVFDNLSSDSLEFSEPGELVIDVIRTHSDKPGCIDDEGRLQMLNFLMASFETSTFSIYMTMVYMALYPDVQEKVFQELQSVFPEKNPRIDVDTISNLVYTTMVMNEVMRLHPPIPLIMRKCTKDTILRNGTFIPKGVEFLIDIYGLHRNEKYWGPDANKFNPDNFRPENKETRPANAFIPFSIGTRNCIGTRYAKVVGKIAVAKIFRKYRLETPDTFADLKYKRGLAMQVVTPITFKVFERSS